MVRTMRSLLPPDRREAYQLKLRPTLILILTLTACDGTVVDLPVELDIHGLTVSLQTLVLRVSEDPVQVTATVTDRFGREVPQAVVEWTSTDPTVATVDGDGSVTAVSAGSAMVIASAGALAEPIDVIVVAALASVAVTPGALDFSSVGAQAALTASVIDTDGAVAEGVEFVWTSMDPTIASVSADGLVTARGGGATIVTATAGSIVGSVPVSVELPSVGFVGIEPTSHPLVRTATVRLESPGTVEVLYWPEGGPILSVTSDAEEVDHEVLLPRLRAGRSYTVLAFPAGTRQVEFGRFEGFETDPLPAELQAIDFVPQTGRPSHEVTMVEIPFRFGDPGAALVMIDPDGEIVWYRLKRPFLYGVTRRANGDFAYVNDGGTLGGTVTIESLDGRIVNELPFDSGTGRGAHHDVITTPWNTLFVLSFDRQEVDGRTIIGEAIWEWDPDTDALDKRWSSFDHFDVDEYRGEPSRDDDWLHANSIAFGRRGNVLMSLRSVSHVISIAPDYQSIEYTLGGHDTPADIELPAGDVFQFQHTATELESTGSLRRLLLFDNGSSGRGSSRALEVEVDVEARTARTLWEFSPPGNWAPFAGGARRLANGNTFITMGSGTIRELYEVDASGGVVWHITLEGADLPIMYRATPLESLAGEREVDFPAGVPSWAGH